MTYDIAQLERLSGVSVHTIRKWEQRYRLITPSRTASNIRVYNDGQVVRLLNVATLLANGYKISKIAALSDTQLVQHIQEVLTSQEKSAQKNYDATIHQLIAATLRFDEPAFEASLVYIIQQLGMETAMLQVLYPFFRRLGLMWLSAEATPLQEHFASNIIRRKLLVAIDMLPAPKHNAKTFVLLLPPNEWHETGLLLADYLIRAKGHQTIYLGQNVPFETLSEIAKNIKPDYVLTFFIARQKADAVLSSATSLSKFINGLPLLIATSLIEKEVLEKHQNINLLSSPRELLTFL